MTESPLDSDQQPKPRGLWSIISPPSPETPVEFEADQSASNPPRSLFDVMRRASKDAAPEVEKNPTDDGVVEIVAPALSSDAAGSAVESPFSALGRIEQLRSQRHTLLLKQIRQSRIGFACGLASVGLSILAIRPEVWMGLPATTTGFSAMILGYLSLSGSQRRELSQTSKLLAIVSIIAGILGVFLGPLVFARIGRH